MKRNFGIIAILLLMTTACSEDKITSENTTNNAIPVKTEQVTKQTFTESIELVGRTVPSEQIPIVPKIPSPIEEVHVNKGDIVKSGDLLFTLEDTQIQQQIAQARSAVQSLENSRNQIRGAVEQQRATQSAIDSVIDNTITELDQIEIPDEFENDDLLTNIRDALNQFESLTESGTAVTTNALQLLETQLAQARKAVKEAESALQATRIKAPIDGTVTQLDAREGVPPLPAKPLALISSKDDLKAVFTVNEFQTEHIREDMSIELHFNDLDKTYELPITSISDQPNEETNTFTMTVTLEDLDPTIASDTVTTGKIALKSTPDALTVPNEALLFDGEQPYVFIAKNGQALKQPITVKAQGDTSSMIADGIEKGDLVVTDGKYQLTHRSKISFKK